MIPAAIGVGATFTRALSVSSDLMASFLRMSGDDNPLHVDPAFAKRHGFRDRIAYGNLIGLLISAVVGVEMQSLNAMLLSETIAFRAPAFCGDVLTLRAVVDNVVDAVGVAELKYRVENETGKLIASGKIQVKFLESAAPSV